MSDSNKNFDRRKFIKSSAIIGAFLGLPGISAFSKNNVEESLESIASNRKYTKKEES